LTWRFTKLSLLIAHVEASVNSHCIEQLLAAVEDFARGPSSQWLKVAGGQKGEVLESAAQCASPKLLSGKVL